MSLEATNPWVGRARASLAAALGLVLLAGCDRSPTDPGNGHGHPAELELFNRATGELVADTDGDHWHGSLILEPGEEIALDAVFLDEDGHEIALGDEYTVRTEIVEGPTDGVVELSDHGDHVDIDAIGPGQVEVQFLLWHGNHADWASPNFAITVQDD